MKLALGKISVLAGYLRFLILFIIIIINIFFYRICKMKRNSIKKASSFKLQAARVKFSGYLEDIEQSVVAKRFPHLLEVTFFFYFRQSKKPPKKYSIYAIAFEMSPLS
jgi:hypothetical protein